MRLVIAIAAVCLMWLPAGLRPQAGPAPTYADLVAVSEAAAR